MFLANSVVSTTVKKLSYGFTLKDGVPNDVFSKIVLKLTLILKIYTLSLLYNNRKCVCLSVCVT